MKNFYAILCLVIASITHLQAQAPQGFNYQATVRNTTGELIINSNVYFKFNVIQGSQTAVPIFTETHDVPTDDLGQVTLIIGEGTANTGVFSEIDWSLGSYYLGIELSINGDNGYVAMGTTQLLSVPYALYAAHSGNATPTIPDLEAVLAENNSANNQQIKDLQDPTDPQDAVTKNYTYSKVEIAALIANLQSQIDNTETTSVTDIDGNTYNYITYGDQDWTVDNAAMETYRDGTPIPQVTDATEWENLTTGAWAYYNNDPTKGKLYNWYAVMGVHDTDESTPNKEFAIEGWHVPSDTEWTTLENQLIANGYNYDDTTTENKIAKAMASTTGWNTSTGTGAIGNDQSTNNSSGFNTFPEGFRDSDASFSGEGKASIFWNSTMYDSDDESLRFLNWSLSYLLRLEGNTKQDGLSVRFVRDGNVDSNDIDDDGDGYSENQGDCDDTNASINPGANEIEDNIDNDCDCDIDEGFNESGTVIDIDGNTYGYITYGDQDWTVDNAAMETYRDGTPIPQVINVSAEWENLTTGAWCYYNNDPTKGKLYNWFAVMGMHDTDPNTPNKEFAPEGWHVPSDTEWTTLENHLIANGYNYDGTTTGNKIAKAMASTTVWNSSTGLGAVGNDQCLNNSSGFNAFPVGIRNHTDSGLFMQEGTDTDFWSSTEHHSNTGWYRSVSHNDSNLSRFWSYGRSSQSVRFVKD